MRIWIRIQIFQMLKMVWIQTGIGAELDFLKLDNMCLCVIFMMRNNSLTKVIKWFCNAK